jgi:RNA-binding protein NOB1
LWIEEMNGNWSSPAEPNNDSNAQEAVEAQEKYYALIVDSGAIIKHSGFSTLHNAAQKYVTVQGVIDEIRDSKARQHLDTLPFQLEVRNPTAEGISRVVEFSKKTGDYPSLSSVDIHVLALQYDLEKEGCQNKVSHIRIEPKRALSGRVVRLNKDDDANMSRGAEESTTATDCGASLNSESLISETHRVEKSTAFFQGNLVDLSDDETESEEIPSEQRKDSEIKSVPHKTWANLVNPTASSGTKAVESKTDELALNNAFSSMKLPLDNETDNVEGQFSDAEDDDSIDIRAAHESESSEDGDEFASIGEEFSDEECDVYILDPDEVEEKKRNGGRISKDNAVQNEMNIAMELEMEFPSLAAAATIPYVEDDSEHSNSIVNEEKLKKAKEEEEQRKKDSLKPISNSGKLYNSFKKYKDLVSGSGVKISDTKQTSKVEEKRVTFGSSSEPLSSTGNHIDSDSAKPKENQSRIIGFSDQSAEIDDDGEGWVTSTNEIVAMKAAGTLDPFGNEKIRPNTAKVQSNLPPKSQRTACATTDFAMQNVILQMNLELLSVNGVKVQKLKSWVSRCAACFHVYTGDENNGKRLFCGKCGSSSLQRIAASVDSRTGRLKLHLKKNYQSNKRGTQFALPKPGAQNRFMGDLLLAEDQLMFGALGQRARTNKSKKEAKSLFGSDITTSVGCDLTKRSDIKVGLGRKNPNSSAVGRERRGKKKKGVHDKACGLRRY